MIRFLALGAPDLHGDGMPEAATALSQPRVLALLAYLAIARPRGFHRRDSLVALFWPELDHDAARNALRQLVHRLRRAVGEDVVVSRGADEIGLDPARIGSDVADFDAALEAGRAADALAQYRGDLLPGFFISDAPEFERWLDEERRRLRLRAAELAAQLAEHHSSGGEHVTAAHFAARAAELAGDDELAVRRQIRILARGGDRTGALRVYQAFERRLAAEFELTPSSETRALVAELQRAGPTSPLTARRADDAPGASATATPVTSGAPALPATGREAGQAEPRRTMVTGAAIGAVVALLAALALWQGARPAASADPPLRTLAVLPFAVRGDEQLAYLGEGMADLLSAKLNGAVGIRAVDPHAVLAAVYSADAATLGVGEAAQVAGRVAADWMITGQLVELAGRLQISASLYDLRAAPEVVATANVAGETTQLFQLVDDLTGRILAGVATGRDTALVRLSALTTHSLPALKAYLEGEQAMRAGLDGRAFAAFREATELDSTFALAQYRLAIASSWASSVGREGADEYAERAVAHAERLTPLLRELVTAYRAYRQSQAHIAEQRYRAIVAEHPDNVEAWMMLAETAFHFNAFRGRSPAESWAFFQRVLALDPANPHALVHLARQAALEGRAAALDSVVERYARTHRDTDRLLEMRALVAWTRGDSVTRAEIAAAARHSADVPFGGLIVAALTYAQHPDAAMDLWPSLSRPDRDRRLLFALYMQFADLGLARGRFSATPLRPPLDSPELLAWRLESEALLASYELFAVPRARALELRRQIAEARHYPALSAIEPVPATGEAMRQYLLGMLSLRLGDSSAAAAAQRALASMRGGSAGDQAAAFATAFETALAAEALRRRGDTSGALARLDEFPLDGSHLRVLAHYGLRERFIRAELLRALGRDAEAMDAYDAFANPYDLPLLPISHLRRGELQQRLGNHEQARFHFQRFVRWWEVADPERQMLVAEARRALAAR